MARMRAQATAVRGPIALAMGIVFCLTSPLSRGDIEAASETFYVASNGDDSWSGQLPAPDGAHADGPFATLPRARAAVRAVQGRARPGPIRVMVRGGKYFLSDTLILDERDSGLEFAPILWCAYPDENPVISGGRRVTRWRTYRGRIMQAELAELGAQARAPDDFFCGGTRQTCARTPNLDRANPLYGGWSMMQGGAGASGFQYAEGLFATPLSKPSRAQVFSFVGPSGGWGSQFLGITAIDYERRVIHTRYDQGENALLGFNRNCRFFVQNSLELLDQPGEWCVDVDAGKLYFWPPVDYDRRVEVVIPSLPVLMTISKARWITVSGLRFTETASAAGAALRCTASEHIRIEKNHLAGLGSRALEIMGKGAPSVDVTIQGNEIAYTGASGIYVGGAARDCRILDNEVHHCAVFDKYAAGIEFPFYGATVVDISPQEHSDRVVVAHNHLHDLPRDGIQLGANPYGRNVVEYNRVERTALETIDAGAIRCHRVISHLQGIAALPTMAGHVIRHNLVIDTRGCGVSGGRIISPQPWPTFGIYLDEGSSGCTVYGNMVIRSGVGAIVNPGESNSLENNIFAGNEVGICYQAPAPFDELRSGPIAYCITSST
jgi:hypothetical protein